MGRERRARAPKVWVGCPERSRAEQGPGIWTVLVCVAGAGTVGGPHGKQGPYKMAGYCLPSTWGLRVTESARGSCPSRSSLIDAQPLCRVSTGEGLQRKGLPSQGPWGPRACLTLPLWAFRMTAGHPRGSFSPLVANCSRGAKAGADG